MRRRPAQVIFYENQTYFPKQCLKIVAFVLYTPSPAEAEFDVLTAGLGTIQLFP